MGIEDSCRMIREALSQNQLVFCPVGRDASLPSDMLKVDSTAVQILEEQFGRVLVLDVSNGCDEGREFNLARFYAYMFSRMRDVFSLRVPDLHHEQDIVQILRDEPQVLLCLVNAHTAPLEMLSRLRSLTQEKHQSLVIYCGHDNPRVLSSDTCDTSVVLDWSSDHDTRDTGVAFDWRKAYAQDRPFIRTLECFLEGSAR